MMENKFTPIKCKLIEYYFTERDKTVKKRQCNQFYIDTTIVISPSIHHCNSIDLYYGKDLCSTYHLRDEEFVIGGTRIKLTHHIPTGAELPKYETFIFEKLENQEYNIDEKGWITFD